MSLNVNFPDYGPPLLSCENIAGLRRFLSQALTHGQNAVAQGFSVIGDGHGGLYVWNEASTAFADNAAIVRPDDLGPSQAGRWVLISGSVEATTPSTVVIPFAITGALGSSEEIVQQETPVALSLAANLSGSSANLRQSIPPANTVSVTVGYYDPSGTWNAFGTVNFDSDGTTVLATTNAATVTIPAYSMPAIIGPSTAEPTLTRFAINLVATVA